MTEAQARQAICAIESKFTIYNGSVDLLEMVNVGGTVYRSWRQLREKIRGINSTKLDKGKVG